MSSHIGNGKSLRSAPVQTTLKMKPDILNLRRRHLYRKIEDCLRKAAPREDAPICDFFVQGDHVHMLVDAANSRALTSAVRGVSIRIARAINKFWGPRVPRPVSCAAAAFSVGSTDFAALHFEQLAQASTGAVGN
jgi:REP element-mobilizing transposase RayT